MSKTLFLVLFISCAGYKFRNKQNPFAQFGVQSISIPMFFNHSNYPNVAPVFTKEILKTMIEYKGLMIHPSSVPSDAVLIGIIDSSDKKRESTRTTISKSVDNTYGESVLGTTREDMLLPGQRTINLRLRLIVIKQPSKEEIVFLSTKMGETAMSSKIIFNEVITLSGTQTLKTLQDEATKVLGTQNRGLTNQVIDSMALSAAGNFKDMILYAF